MRVDLADARNTKSLSTRFRKRRDKILRKFILEARTDRQGSFRIIDLGGTTDYWRRVGLEWLELHDIDVTCVNHIGTEFGVSKRESARLRCIIGDACNMINHDDNSFDMVHSNSVVEHVGGWPEMRRFGNEVRRLAPSYYIQTPYFWFPIDPHFYRVPMFHWLPVSLRVKLLQRMKVGWAPAVPDFDHAMRNVMSAVLLDATQFRALFPEANIVVERVALLPKSMIALH